MASSSSSYRPVFPHLTSSHLTSSHLTSRHVIGYQRVIVYSKSANGSTWDPVEYVGAADWRDGQGDQFVGLLGSDGPLAGFATSGGKKVFVGMYNVFHQLHMTITTQVITSSPSPHLTSPHFPSLHQLRMTTTCTVRGLH
jgi:hypothetical protein